MLLDTEEKRLYFGEAQDFVGRALLHKAVDASDRYPLTARFVGCRNFLVASDAL